MAAAIKQIMSKSITQPFVSIHSQELDGVTVFFFGMGFSTALSSNAQLSFLNGAILSDRHP